VGVAINRHGVIIPATHVKANLFSCFVYRGILCKGLEYPPVQPRPVMVSLPLQLPLCEPQLERTEHEVSSPGHTHYHTPIA
jgi:hypothetical protein